MSSRKGKQIALTAPVDGLKMSKPARIELIRKFQRTEGNFDCCGSAYSRVCQQFTCLWRGECLEKMSCGESHEQRAE